MIVVVRQRRVDLGQAQVGMGLSDLIGGHAHVLVLLGDLADLDVGPGNHRTRPSVVNVGSSPFRSETHNRRLPRPSGLDKPAAADPTFTEASGAVTVTFTAEVVAGTRDLVPDRHQVGTKCVPSSSARACRRSALAGGADGPLGANRPDQAGTKSGPSWA